MDNENTFSVDLHSLDKPRKNGVSGLLRVKNDAEFIEASVESCIDALDELIITYNGCTDNSPEIIHKLALKYPQKIKVYEYTPALYAGALDKQSYLDAIKEGRDSIHMLSNYYNYTLSKSTYRYVLKIDADQIYDTYKLKEICNAYRCNKKTLEIKDRIIFTISLIYIGIAIKLRVKLPCNNYMFQKYHSVVLNYVRRYKIPTSLSGINLFIDEDNNKYITLGGDRILPPFNGCGDTTIWKVSSSTYFEPFDNRAYARENGNKYQIIERLIGVKRLIPIGFMWVHLNACRKCYYNDNLMKLRLNPTSFLSVKEFLSIPSNSIFKLSSIPLDNAYRIIYRYLLLGINKDFLHNILHLKFHKHKILS